MKKIDIYEALKEEGFDLSYLSVISAINKIEKVRKEAYIKQEYIPGEIVEFDFGTVVYDNTRVVVKRFIGKSDKEPTDALLKLSLYYKFDYRFCNAYSGNEKGHVERSVELIRRKAFSRNLNFTNIDAADEHLIDILKEINDKTPFGKAKSTKELLEFEKENFLSAMPLYETATITEVIVSKYPTIMIDSSYYFVPDRYVDRLLRCKIYTGRILVLMVMKKLLNTRK